MLLTSKPLFVLAPPMLTRRSKDVILRMPYVKIWKEQVEPYVLVKEGLKKFETLYLGWLIPKSQLPL
ncbi:MAG: hypothetical protein EZS28_001781 [Streblomastix strix]|uniref:Uncharacterized protein n=1 Tax=Streblomastix strix TaxID=222440 RepID=A0A5J4X7W0_9EUKA|nr:MAG: hypothetical protein EZS28_001781 [Streblomastix strix]